jgi:hypothetical protein
MAKRRTRQTFTVRFTVRCSSNDSLSGMVQTEDQDESEKRVLLGNSGVADVKLPAGDYTFVWAVKMTPIQRHRYSIKAERIPEAGDPVELRKRPAEQTTTDGEDVGFDEFTL